MQPASRFRLLCAMSLLWTVASSPAEPARAAEGRWENIGPLGGYVSALAVAPSNRRILYAGTAEGLVFRSANAGTSWTLLKDDFPDGVAALEVDPRTSSTVYAASCHAVRYRSKSHSSQHGIFKTTDAGRTWELLLEQSFCGIWDLAVDPHQPSRIFASTDLRGLLRSDDGGETWQTSPGLAGSGRVRGLAFGPSPGTLFLLHQEHGVLKSVDGGATWAPKNNGLNRLWQLAGVASSAGAPATLYAWTSDEYSDGTGLVFRSTNGGASWSPADTGLRGLRVSDLVVSRASGVAFAATDAGVFRSADRGRTWSATGPAVRFPRVLALPSTPDTAVYAGTRSEGVFRSADGGGTWQAANRGLTGVPVAEVEVAPSDPDVLYARTTEWEVLRTLDGGATWQPALQEAFSRALAVHPHDPHTAFSAGPSIHKTTDAGASWRELPVNEIECSALLDIDIDPQTPDTVYATGSFSSCAQWPDGCIQYKTADGGESWSCMENLQGFIDAFALAPSLPTVLYAGTHAIGVKPVLKSLDGGETWVARSRGLPDANVTALAVSPQDPRTVYAVVRDHGLYKSGNGGGSWSPSGRGLPGAPSTLGHLVISPWNPAELYILASRVSDPALHEVTVSIFRSTDTGASWKPFSKAGLPETPLLSLQTSPAEPRTLYVTTRFGVYRRTLPE